MFKRAGGHWALLPMLLALTLLCACSAPAQTAPEQPPAAEAELITVTDMAGREVAIPQQVDTVFTADQAATVLVYQLAPDKLLGWNYELNEAERAFIPAPWCDLPVWGMGDSINAEAIMTAAPDVVLMVGQGADGGVSEADSLQKRLHIPVLVVDGSLEHSAAAFRFAGQVTGETERAEALAAFCEQTFAWLESAVAGVGAETVSLYFGNGENSLNTAVAGGPGSQVLELAGAVNVVQTGLSASRIDISKEQLLAWSPQVVLLNGEPTQNMAAAAAVADFVADPDYALLPAVREGRVYAVPKAPFSWIDRPPGPNRIIGLYWVFAVCYPQRFDLDLRQTVRDFYRLFYHLELSDDQLDLLLNA